MVVWRGVVWLLALSCGRRGLLGLFLAWALRSILVGPRVGLCRILGWGSGRLLLGVLTGMGGAFFDRLVWVLGLGLLSKIIFFFVVLDFVRWAGI